MLSPVTPSESGSESEQDQRTIGRDQRKVFKHQKKNLLSRSLSLGVNRPLELIATECSMKLFVFCLVKNFFKFFCFLNYIKSTVEPINNYQNVCHSANMFCTIFFLIFN